MFNFKKGCKVPFPDKIMEEYEKTEYGYVANVSVEKIINILIDFVNMQDDLVFFFLELPTNLADEPEKENGIATNFHKDIYYMDSLTNLYSHRRFHELLSQELANADANNEKVSVLIFDINDINIYINKKMGERNGKTIKIIL